jgi:pimeloyl-ACP methyl ester carboxylesterase
VVADLLDTLQVDPVVLVGHSMGGEIAAEVALTAPARVQGLVLVGAAGLGTRAPAAVRAARTPILGWLATPFAGRGMVERQLRSTYADPARVTAQQVDQYYSPLREPGGLGALRRTLRRFRFDTLGPHIRRIQAPTLVLWGATDVWIPLTYGRRMALELPSAALVVIPDAGHNVMEERPDELNRSLIDYLRNGLPRPPADMATR